MADCWRALKGVAGAAQLRTVHTLSLTSIHALHTNLVLDSSFSQRAAKPVGVRDRHLPSALSPGQSPHTLFVFLDQLTMPTCVKWPGGASRKSGPPESPEHCALLRRVVSTAAGAHGCSGGRVHAGIHSVVRLLRPCPPAVYTCKHRRPAIVRCGRGATSSIEHWVRRQCLQAVAARWQPPSRVQIMVLSGASSSVCVYTDRQ